MRTIACLALVAALGGCASLDVADLARLRELRARLEDRDLAERREPDAEALRAFVRAPGRAALLERLAASPDPGERDLGRFALAADAGIARSIHARLARSPDPSIRFQAKLALEPWPPHGIAATPVRVEMDGWPDHVHAGARDLDGDGRAESLRCTHFAGAYGHHERLEVLGPHGEAVAEVLAVDGSIRLLDPDGPGRGAAVLVSEIHAEGTCGRAVAWVGVVAVAHRLYAWDRRDFALRDRFFTPFTGRYP